MNWEPQMLNFLKPVRENKISCPESLREKCHIWKEVRLGSPLIKYFHLFLDRKKVSMVDSVPVRESNVREAGGKPLLRTRGGNKIITKEL